MMVDSIILLVNSMVTKYIENTTNLAKYNDRIPGKSIFVPDFLSLDSANVVGDPYVTFTNMITITEERPEVSLGENILQKIKCKPERAELMGI